MAISLVAFSLNSAIYQDVSGGFADCSFRLPYSAQRNVIRVALGTSLPAVDTADFDEFISPKSEDTERQIAFTELAPTEHVYVRAARDAFTLKVYRK